MKFSRPHFDVESVGTGAPGGGQARGTRLARERPRALMSVRFLPDAPR